MSGKLTKAQQAILQECDTPMGRLGWPLSDWESVVLPVVAPMIEAGLLIERRLAGYPGVQITPAGRTALKEKNNG